MLPLLLSILMGTVAAAEGAAEPEGCQAYVVPSSAPTERLTFPCGKYFDLEKPGSYRIWLERPGEVSSVQGLLWSVPVGPDTPIRFTFIPAGSVQVSGIKDADSYRVVAIKRGVFEKRLAAGEVEQMPAGNVLAGAFDADGNALALAKPVKVEEGRTTSIEVAPPSEGSDLLVVLGKRGPRPPGDQLLPILVDTGSGGRKADTAIDTGDRIIAAWYGLTGETAKVTVQAKGWEPHEATVPLVNKRAATYRGAIDAE